MISRLLLVVLLVVLALASAPVSARKAEEEIQIQTHSAGLPRMRHGVVDEDKRIAYFCQDTDPLVVVAIDLSATRPSIINTITFEEEKFCSNAFIDPIRRVLLFVTQHTGLESGALIRVHLEDFSYDFREDRLPIPARSAFGLQDRLLGVTFDNWRYLYLARQNQVLVLDLDHYKLSRSLALPLVNKPNLVLYDDLETKLYVSSEPASMPPSTTKASWFVRLFPSSPQPEAYIHTTLDHFVTGATDSAMRRALAAGWDQVVQLDLSQNAQTSMIVFPSPHAAIAAREAEAVTLGSSSSASSSSWISMASAWLPRGVSSPPAGQSLLRAASFAVAEDPQAEALAEPYTLTRVAVESSAAATASSRAEDEKQLAVDDISACDRLVIDTSRNYAFCAGMYGSVPVLYRFEYTNMTLLDKVVLDCDSSDCRFQGMLVEPYYGLLYVVIDNPAEIIIVSYVASLKRLSVSPWVIALLLMCALTGTIVMTRRAKHRRRRQTLSTWDRVARRIPPRVPSFQELAEASYRLPFHAERVDNCQPPH